MLVLSRKIGETVVIGGNIEVTITRVAGNRVTLGINAPSSVRVVRAELERAETQAAAVASEQQGSASTTTQETVAVTRVSQLANGAGETASHGSNLKASEAISAPIRVVASGDDPAPILSTVG